MTQNESRLGPRNPLASPAGFLVLVVALVALVILAAIGTVALAAGDASGWLGRGGQGPARDDYVPIDAVPRQQQSGRTEAAGGSAGWFTSHCGTNQGNHHNADNLITLPGEPGAAQHVHEYVGNDSTDATSTDYELAAAATTCTNGDRSAYFWPVLRDLTSHHQPAGPGDWHGGDHNGGTRLAATSLHIRYRGNPTSSVVAMPRFLRLLAGNSRSLTLPTNNASKAQWGCSGSAERQTQLYPLCPDGRAVVRTYDFPNCWDGRRTDSPTHREHVVYPGPAGACPHNTFPIPQLRLQVSYTVPSGRSYAIDGFPDQQRSPLTDHAEFINVMPETLMARAVDCINTGRNC